MHTIPKALDTDGLYEAFTLGVGLRADDLRQHLYPAIRYHALFAPPALRDLPPNALGRVTIKYVLQQNMLLHAQILRYSRIDERDRSVW